VALLLTAVAVMPVFGAVTGTISVNKAYVAPTGSATITVTDADLNVLLPATDTQSKNWSSAGVTHYIYLPDSEGQSGMNASSGFAKGDAVGDEIAGTPVAAAATGSQALTDFGISVFNRTTGRISVQYAGDSSYSGSLTLTYNIASKNATTAKVTSPSDATGITVALTETGADTGIFTGNFSVATATVAGSAILAVAGQDVTVKYTDASPSLVVQTTVRVESTAPTGVLISPTSGSNSTSLAPKLTIDFTDMDSTVDNGTFAFVIDGATTAADAAVVVAVGTPTVTAITNGFRAVVTLDASLAKDKTVAIRWHATVSDKAGNAGRTDSSASTSGSQNYTLIIDKQAPNFGSATISAGAWWDTAATGGAAVETDATKSSSTTIGILLPVALELAGTLHDVPEELSAASVTTADFEVDNLKQLGATATLSDIAPTAVNVYAGAPNWIFLTVPAMAPDAKPSVTLKSTSGGISDAAGNATAVAVGPTVAADKQAPTVTAVLSRDLHKTDSTLTITTDEAGAVPAVTVTGLSEVAQTVTLVGTNIYESKITPGNGMHSVKVTVLDTNNNTTVVGGKTITSAWPVSGAIALYADSALPAPAVTANNISASGASVESSEPFFITAAYAGEGSEYGLLANGNVTNVGSSVVTDLDIQNTVTIATATLDGVSILGKLDTQDNITFNFAITGIETGAHKLTLVATDEAGNENTVTDLAFTVTARKDYSVAMSAGWNLVSLPGTPADTSIGAVLPSTHTATEVYGFDDGVWSAASREAGGTWVGDLTTIDGSHGYWINSSSSQPVKTLLALTSVGSAATLPTVAIEAGWNLVSVIDLAQAKQDSTANSADDATGASYFTSIDWSVAYTYSASTRAWTRITPAASGGSVQNGQGVWVWADKAGTLLPL